MSMDKMFTGLNKKEWAEALTEQNVHLQEKYDYQIDTGDIDADAMNQKTSEAMSFMTFMANSLKNGVSVSDKSVSDAIENHIRFMQKDMNIDAKSFAAQTRFLMTDDSHRQMLEGQQVGLSYYICFAAESYAN